MSTDWAEEVALTEAAFRIANERTSRWEERHRDRAQELYLCECAARPCRERIPLTREQYEAVRSDVRRFFVVPGHVIPDLETVVESFAAYQVIEKPNALIDLLTQTNPRAPRAGEAADAARTIADEIDPAAE